MDILLPLFTGVAGYALVNFFITPLLRVLTLRQEMHEKLHLYANAWSSKDEFSKYWTNKAREDFRTMAARGLAESENLSLGGYCLVRWALKSMKVDLKTGAEKFWAMEAAAVQPDKKTRAEAEKIIRQSLRLPQ